VDIDGGEETLVRFIFDSRAGILTIVTTGPTIVSAEGTFMLQ
jgi:hypothetical protein